MVELVIDNRENIKDLVKETLPEVFFENLLVGDYEFRINSKPFIVIERKTISDYAASIVDSRGREQKKRLLANKSKTNIMYLIEGDITKDNSCFKYNKVNRHTIISSVINTMYRDGIQVFHTSNVMETIFLLESILHKLTSQSDTFLESKSSYEDDLINTVKINKGSNMTPRIGFRMMLNCIPSVSNKVSKRLSEKYDSINMLIDALKKIEDTDKRLEFIKNIKMSDDVGAKKLSKTVASNILSYTGLI
jgi:ERCC4-type nuclease|tara:strand:+ start:228 stop:974 length:747 start_codon:yes stop_codon:yes gene_type:complete